MSPSPEHHVRFGPFNLDLRTGELWKGGAPVSLPEQPFQVLKALLDRPGELVTREELRQRLWRADTFVDFEHGVNAAVRRLRDALGDSADVPRFVETMPRRGYRFIAPVTGPVTEPKPSTPPPDVASQHDASGLPPAQAFPRRPMRALLLLILPVLMLAAVASLWRAGDLPSPDSGPKNVVRLAVLPGNLTGDPEQEYLSDGLTDELILQLNMIDPSRLAVVAFQSAMHYKGTTKRADEIGRELNVAYLLHVNLHPIADRARITAQLVDVEHQTSVWAQPYEHDAREVRTLPRQAAEDIARRVAARLGIAGSSASARRHSSNDVARGLYDRGRFHLRKNDREGLTKAMKSFLEAIELDEDYALAWSGLADTYIMRGSDGFLTMHDAYRAARDAAQRALRLDERLPEVHVTLASIAADYDWNWDAARHHFERALSLDANYELGLRSYSFFLSCMGKHPESLFFARRAQELNPQSVDAWMNLSNAHYFAREWEPAIAASQEALDLEEDHGPAHVTLGRIYAARGQFDRAVNELERARALMGDRPDVTAPLAYVLAKAGRHQEARSMLTELQRLAEPGHPSPFRLAYVHIGLGRTTEAFALLHKSIEARDWQVAMLRVEPAFDALRSDRRFDALIEGVRLPP